MSEQKITKEQLNSIMKSNPEFAKRVVSGSAIKDSTNPTRIFTTLDDAKVSLGLAEFEFKPEDLAEGDDKIEVVDGCFELGSGVIQPNNKDIKAFFESTLGKSMISIGLTSKNYSIYRDIINLGIHSEIKVDYKKAIVPIRFCIVKKNDDGKLSTISHIDPEAMPLVGKWNVAKFKVVNDEKKDDEKTNFTIYIQANYETGEISFATDHNIDGIFIVPIVISKEALEQNKKHIETVWDDRKDEFKNKLIDGYSEEEAVEIVKYINESKYLENDTFSKALAIYALENDNVHRIEDAIESNTKKIDALSIAAALFPRYGDEYINFEEKKILCDEESGIPVITEQDINNLKIIGFRRDFIIQIISAGTESYKMAKSVLDTDTEDKRKEITAASYDAECRLIVDLGTDRWVDSLDKDFDAIAELHNYEATIKGSKEHIDDIKQQIASLQVTSRRISTKIEGGEFVNMYMQLCNNYMTQFAANYFGQKIEEWNKKNFTPFVDFLNVTNDRNCKEREHVTNRIKESITNTIALNFKRNKFGTVPVSLFDQAERIADALFDTEAIAENTPENEIDKKIMDLVFTRFNFIDSLSRTPYKFAARIYPKVFNLDSKVDIEKAEKNSEEYIEKGFGYNPSEFCAETVDEALVIGEKLKKIKDHLVNSTEPDGYWLKLRDSLNKYSNTLSTTKCKGNFDKAKLFSKYFVLLNFYEYADTLATGFAKWNGSIDEAKATADYNDNFRIEFNEKMLTIDEFLKFTNGKPAAYVILKKVTEDEKTNIKLDWYLRASLFSLFLQSFVWGSGKYTDYCENALKDSRSKLQDEYGKMFVSELGLFVPAISVLESENKPIAEVVPNDMKIKLGTNAVDDVLKGLDDVAKLNEARRTYLFQSITYVSIAVDGLLKFFEVE